MQALDERGVTFTSAYCPSPLCGPSRFALMVGQLPSRIGAYDNACKFAAQTPTLAHYLRAGGYRTVLAGKMHFVGPDQIHGFEERLTTDIYPADFSWTPDWKRPGHRPSWYHSMDSVLSAGPTLRTNQIDFDEEVVHKDRTDRSGPDTRTGLSNNPAIALRPAPAWRLASTRPTGGLW